MKGAMANGSDNPITLIERTNFRNEHKAFGIRQTDRRAHLYIIGKPVRASPRCSKR